MSRHNRDRRRAPPVNPIPQNVTGAFAEIKELHVSSWNPLPDGKGPSTQVHLRIDLKDFDVPFVMRFKGPDTLDQLIDALERHRYDVWPTKGDQGG